MRQLAVLAALALAPAAPGAAFDFDAPVAAEGRANPYGLPADELAAAQRRGLLHALHHPEIEHSLTLPWKMADDVVSQARRSPAAMAMLKAMGIARFGTSWDEIFASIGLMPYPAAEGAGPFLAPFADGVRPELPMGASVRANEAGVEVLSFGCVACHARNLFGRPVIGLNNLQTRSTEFVNAATVAKNIPRVAVYLAAHGDRAQYDAFRNTQARLELHDGVDPKGLGNDPALANTALTLFGREAFRETAAEVKPGVWWNMRYKNRAFVDGSLRGNPVLTNLLWMERGLGAEAAAFAAWIDRNEAVVRDLTVAVYAAEAPRWTDFFPAASLDVEAARRGEATFLERCAGCHGEYEKDWDAGTATTFVRYRAETRAFAVGTDPARAAMIGEVAGDLNALDFVRRQGLWIEPQPGKYVPPPLVGIWARWPYFHNSSVPSLCEVLKPAAERTPGFYVVPAEVVGRDFDADCVGFPLGAQVAPVWRTEDRWLDTGRQGLGNMGHEVGLGLSEAERRDLVMFLKTL